MGDPDFNLGLKALAAPGWSKQPLYPDEAQVKVYVKLAEALYPAWVGRGVLDVEQTIEIPFYDYVAEIDRNRTNQTQFIFVPKGAGNVPHSSLQHISSANLETRSADAAVDRVEVCGYVMAGIAERADYDVDTAHPPGVGL
jgi:hypothetical protein